MEPWRHPELVIPDIVCVLVCLVATVTDLRSRRIPNWLTFPSIVIGLVLNTVIPALSQGLGGLKLGLVSSVAGCLLLLLCFGLFGLLRFVGFGDVKLMAAVGALLRWPTALWALVYVGLAGGGIAVGYALFKGRLGKVLGNLVAIGSRVVKRKEGEIQLHRIPYGLAILVGATWAAAIKYFPWLALG
jgi:prepilin peptidase CpaA